MQSYDDPDAMAGDNSNAFYSQPSSQQAPASGLPHPDTEQHLRLLAQQSQSHSRALAPSLNAGPVGILSETQDLRGQPHFQQDQAQQQHTAAVHLQASPGQMPVQYESSPGGSNSKRTKVSRACDECRRKKIRCDAQDESSEARCSNCDRVGARCQFSRVPMKRGPSKGYIKELADRVQNLEGSLQVQQGSEHYLDSPQLQRASEEFSPADDNLSRKRAYSAVSGDLGPYEPSRPATGWASQDLHRQLPPLSNQFPTHHSTPPSTNTMSQELSYPQNGLQPTPQWHTRPEPVRRPSNSFDDAPQADNSERAADWDENIVDEYYILIHPTYPILALSKKKVRIMINQCPASLREAFLESLHAAVRSCPTSKRPAPEQQSSRKAAHLLMDFQTQNSADRTTATNLIYLQIMLLMAIEADNCDPARAQVGPSQIYWLGSAVGLAYSMKLYAQKNTDRQFPNDNDSDERIARRIWWSLVMMDRWHAASICCPLLIPDTSVVVFQDDRAVLGETIYDLARLIVILGHATLLPTDLSEAAFFSPMSLNFTLLKGEVDRYRESLSATSFPSPTASVAMQLSYWTLMIFMARRLPQCGPIILCESAISIVKLLKSNPDLYFPLTHHAHTFAAVAFFECMGNETTRKEAEKGLGDLIEARIAPSGWGASIRNMIVKGKKSGQSSGAGGAAGSKSGTSQHDASHLRELAEAAELAGANSGGKGETSTGNARKESTGGKSLQRFHDLREMVRSGYLSGNADR